MPPSVRACQHCHQTRLIRARGLCWACHFDPAIKAKYAPAKPSRPEGWGRFEQQFDGRGQGRLPTPTDAAPGSEAKILEMAARYAKRQRLHHPLDGELDMSRLSDRQIRDYLAYMTKKELAGEEAKPRRKLAVACCLFGSLLGQHGHPQRRARGRRWPRRPRPVTGPTLFDGLDLEPHGVFFAAATVAVAAALLAC